MRLITAVSLIVALSAAPCPAAEINDKLDILVFGELAWGYLFEDSEGNELPDLVESVTHDGFLPPEHRLRNDLQH